MQDLNKEKFDFLGITKFKECGYKGQGIKIASRESNNAKHGGNVMDVLKQVAEGSEFYEKVDYTNIGYLLPDIYTTSWFLSSDGNESNKASIKKLYDDGAFICCAVGNGDTNKFSDNECVASIGACILNNKGQVSKASYSSVTNLIKFSSLSNIYSSSGQKLCGTSFSSPLFAGMLALLQSFFLQKINRKLTNDEIWSFVKEHSQDLGVEGKDDSFGYGIFILPDPANIDLAPYNNQEITETKKEQPEITPDECAKQVADELSLIPTECTNCGKLKSLLNKLLAFFKFK